jgi:hypothetical protein
VNAVPARARTSSVVLAAALLALAALLGFAPGHPGRVDLTRTGAVVSDHGAALAAHGQRAALAAQGQRAALRPHTVGTDQRADGLPWATAAALAVLILPVLVAALRRRTVRGLVSASGARALGRAPPVAA